MAEAQMCTSTTARKVVEFKQSGYVDTLARNSVRHLALGNLGLLVKLFRVNPSDCKSRRLPLANDRYADALGRQVWGCLTLFCSAV